MPSGHFYFGETGHFYFGLTKDSSYNRHYVKWKVNWWKIQVFKIANKRFYVKYSLTLKNTSGSVFCLVYLIRIKLQHMALAIFQSIERYLSKISEWMSSLIDVIPKKS